MKLRISVLGLLLIGAVNIGAMKSDQTIDLEAYLNDQENGFAIDKNETQRGKVLILGVFYNLEAIKNLINKKNDL